MNTVTEAVAVCLVSVTLTLFVSQAVMERIPHPANACHEDENWVATHHLDPEGIEWRGVTRKCLAVDDSPWELGEDSEG